MIKLVEQKSLADFEGEHNVIIKTATDCLAIDCHLCPHFPEYIEGRGCPHFWKISGSNKYIKLL